MLTVDEFVEIYNDTFETVHSANYNHNPFIHKKGRKLYIDDKALLRRRNFMRRVWMEAHENYYILAEHKSDSDMSRILSRFTDRSMHTWNSFQQKSLFSLTPFDKSLLSYKVNDMLYEYWRITRAIIRRSRR